MTSESFDYKFFNEGSEGLKVALVHHLDMPIVRQIGFHISPGTENQIAVTPTLISTSNDAMVRFSPDRRDCYSEGEIRDGGGSIVPLALALSNSPGTLSWHRPFTIFKIMCPERTMN